MKIQKIIDVPKAKTEDVICDICGKSCKTEHGFEYMKLKTWWGFESNHDMEKWTAQVCESCVEEHLVPLINFNTNHTRNPLSL